MAAAEVDPEVASEVLAVAEDEVPEALAGRGTDRAEDRAALTAPVGLDTDPRCFTEDGTAGGLPLPDTAVWVV